MSERRWPPIYDEIQLENQIKELATRDAIEKWFFAPDTDAVTGWCQGDLLVFDALLPELNDQLRPFAKERHSLWVLLSNTCDLDRKIEDNPWAIVAPIMALGIPTEIPKDKKQSLEHFKTVRQMYWPHWPSIESTQSPFLWCLDWTRVCNLDRRALNLVKRRSQLSTYGWVLFHCALVRFLARDDGRFD